MLGIIDRLRGLRRFNFGHGESTGVKETLLATSFLYSPNFLFYFFGLEILFMLYNFIVLYLLISTITHKRFYVKGETDKQLKELIKDDRT